MTSIARTFALSLGIAATTIFLIMLGLFIWRYPMEEREFRACRVVAAVLDRATIVEGQNLTVRPTRAPGCGRDSRARQFASRRSKEAFAACPSLPDGDM